MENEISSKEIDNWLDTLFEWERVLNKAQDPIAGAAIGEILVLESILKTLLVNLEALEEQAPPD